MKTVDSEVCGLLREMATLFLGKDAAVYFSFNVIFNAARTTNEIHLRFIGLGVEAEILRDY